MSKKVAVIAGAGVAGLTAAMELMKTTDITPLVFEMDRVVGGISKTIDHNGNRMDIGGHRFFSKSDRIMLWWEDILPIGKVDSSDYDNVMLTRHRVSRIFYLNKFFDYPITLSIKTMKNLGFRRLIRVGFSYMKAMLFPIKPEGSLEDFFINRFGKELYETFFKDYTEKVWGVPCKSIKPDWGAQRIKGISIKAVLRHAFKSLVQSKKNGDISQKGVETSLIDQFFYPKYGVGQMWDEVARDLVSKGVSIQMDKRIVKVNMAEGKVSSVVVENMLTHQLEEVICDYFFSSMPIKDLVQAIDGTVPDDVFEVASGLSYRDFISVGLLLKRFDLGNEMKGDSGYRIKDNWIYIQETSVKMGRIQVFNNWSPYMVKDTENVWIGLEYFCNESDEFWRLDDAQIIAFATNELIRLEAIDLEDVLDSTVVRMPKAYPSYIGAYDRFDIVKAYLDGIDNLFLIGRNGMHRYNNMDHSMLTAMAAVDLARTGNSSKASIWSVNAEDEYHEAKKEA